MFTHRHLLRVIYGDTDRMGVVYYANYLRYFEAGRTELLRALEVPYLQMEKDGYVLPVSNATVKYHAPADYDDLLALDTTVEEVRRASVRISYRLLREGDGELIATGETVHACIGPSGTVTRLPEALRERLANPTVKSSG